MKYLPGKPARYWIFQAIGWGILVLINIFFFYTFGRIDQLHFQRLLLSVVVGVTFSHLMRDVSHRIGVLKRPSARQMGWLFLITVIFGFIGGTVEALLADRFGLTYTQEAKRGLLLVALSMSFNYVVTYFMWNSIYFMYHFLERARGQELDTLRLEALVKELELKTIKSHINPHFIFNALNSIRALIDENPVRARAAVTGLGNILRSSLQSQNLETVTLGQELNVVKDYLALEHIRFEDRLRVEYDIEEGTLDMHVPPMMLQTLVENAIKHGIGKQIGGGVVHILSRLAEGRLELVVRNTGRLGLSETGSGFGLTSTSNRLGLLFGDAARFSIRDTEAGMVEAKLEIPAAAA